ncbi:MAG: glycosyltransferase [Caldilineales bacterium]|nr:glycosyltransferase [Caldilineales bacterium]MCW5856739.1 glycosyltransferase [Caldilineales bacterium]
MSDFIKSDHQGLSTLASRHLMYAFAGAVVPPDDADRYPGYGVAGNLWQIRLIRALQVQGFRCTEIASVRPVPSFPRLRKIWFASDAAVLPDGIAIGYLPFLNVGPAKTLSLAMANFVGMLRWGWRYRHERDKVIITYNLNAPHGLSTVFAARMVRTKVFAVIADLPVPGQGIVPSSVMRRMEFSSQVRSMRWFDGLIVLTRCMSQDFASQVPYLIMEGAVDEALMESIETDPQPKATHQFTLMYAGALSEFDGVPLLLEAFSQLDGDSYRLIIVGRGPEQERVERQAQSDPRIFYLGYVTHEKVLQLYQQADVLINPRPSEPLSTRYVFPSKLIEYLATGKIVITTATAGVLEEYGSFVFVLEDETSDGLAKLVYQIAAIPETERRAMGQAVRRYMLEHKTWTAQGRRISGFLREQFDKQ